MTKRAIRGVTLIELLVVMAVASLVSGLVLPSYLNLQARTLAEIGRNDLQDRADRLLRFMVNDIRESGFLTGAAPRQADGSPLVLVHDSLSGDPAETLARALTGTNQTDDSLTLVKAVSFAPPLTLWFEAEPGSAELVLNRRPNDTPGSSRELLPAPEAISHLLLANQPACYAVESAGQTTRLAQPLVLPAPAGTELFGVRVYRYTLEATAGTGRLRRDDFTSREILDNAVDGLQFELLQADGTLASLPGDPNSLRGVKISLLVRALKADADYRDSDSYQLGDRRYGPFDDHYRRLVVTQTIEVKNHAVR